MTNVDVFLEERLKKAEQAESEVNRLQPLAAEAPALRDKHDRAQWMAERHGIKAAAMVQAKEATKAATEKQLTVPELLGNAARAVKQLYSTLAEIEGRRQTAMHALAIADRTDYELELKDGEEHERSLGRDPRGLAYALAGRHGDVRVKKLFEELQPGFELLEGCHLDDPVYRDVANFVMQRIKPAVVPTTAANNQPATKTDNGGIPENQPNEEVPEITRSPMEQEQD